MATTIRVTGQRTAGSGAKTRRPTIPCSGDAKAAGHPALAIGAASASAPVSRCHRTSPSNTSAGTKRTRTRVGRESVCRRSRSGSTRPHGGRTRASAGTRGATSTRPARTPTSDSSAWARRRPVRIPSARAHGAARRWRATCGSGRRPTSPRTPASVPSRTPSTPTCSSVPSTRCCGADRGRCTRWRVGRRSATGTTRFAARSSPASAARDDA